MRIIILKSNNISLLEKIKDKTSIVNISKIIDKINNNDILKYPANNSVINFYLILELISKINTHDVVYIIANNENLDNIYQSVENIIKIQKLDNVEIFCILQQTNFNYLIYRTYILDLYKWSVEFDNKIVGSEIEYEDIQNKMSSYKFNDIGYYSIIRNNQIEKSILYSF